MENQLVLDTVQLNAKFYMGNNNAENVFHAKTITPPGTTDLDELAAVFVGWLDTDWSPLAAAGWSCNQLILTGLSTLTSPRKSYGISPPQAGRDVEDAMPANSTLAVKASVGRRGKGINGRVFWVGLAEDQVAGNTVNTVTCSAIVAALNNLNSLVTGLDAFSGLCVPHLVVNKTPVNPASSELITEFLITDTTIDSQRDRLPGHKRHKRYPIA